MAPPSLASPLGPRSAGVLLHPTSLPGPHGIGDMGPWARRWVDALATAHQSWWQVLPLSPTGYADSPYQCLSTFAGNPLLISPEVLVEEGLLTNGDMPVDPLPDDKVDFATVIPRKMALLARAWERFQGNRNPDLQHAFLAFRTQASSWIEDAALFMALKDAHGGGSWLTWDEALRKRRPDALASARTRLADAVDQHCFRQFLFFRQWTALKTYAHAKGVRLIGDLPIFVALDAADVWSHPEYFQLDAHAQPTVVAGVPPDYFSPTGQRWGNPLFAWKRLQEDHYTWWVRRMEATLAMVDLVRIDHFRGFEAYWEIPGDSATAETGRWVPGPGPALFEAFQQRLGSLPILAEDLGVITPEVDALKAQFHLPGMRILQFAFADPEETRFRPHHHERNTVVYTGTHDNDTTRGWYAAADAEERMMLERYLGHPCDEAAVSWTLVRMAWASVADLAVAPLQDILNLGSEARMNFPGQGSGWWRWRFTASQLTDHVIEDLGALTETYQRLPAPRDPKAPLM